MVVGENSRADDMDVNITKEKQLTNMRLLHLRQLREADPVAGAHPRGGLEFAREDECVEVTPRSCASARSSSTPRSAPAPRPAGARSPTPDWQATRPPVPICPALEGRASEHRAGDPRPALRLRAGSGEATRAVREGLGVALATSAYGISFGALAVSSGPDVWQTCVLQPADVQAALSSPSWE